MLLFRLSREESELLMAALSVPYVRLPLVLEFFATHDRVTYLYNTSLRALLRAAIFEAVRRNKNKKFSRSTFIFS
jgi:hypothetical protein